MNILFFDTETTGLPERYDLKPQQFARIPRMVQLAYQCFEVNLETKEYNCTWYDSHIIKPDGFIIPPESSKIHGIDMQKANEEGISVSGAILDMLREVDADLVVCHNYDFDMMILGGECYRSDLHFNFDRFSRKKSYCTMKENKEFVGIYNSYFKDYKFPKLQELHHKLFNKGFDNAHDATNDVDATAKCFFELVRLGIVKL
jgi:DNA polymerase III epsilon subunit-like protein